MLLEPERESSASGSRGPRSFAVWYRSLHRFLQLSWRDRLMVVEALAWLGIARLAIIVLPFRWIAPYLGHQQRETPVMDGIGQRECRRRVAQAVARMSRQTPWDNTCLVQAIAAKMMLRCRGVSSTLYLGVMKHGAAGFAAHAWLRSGTVILTGAPGRERFTVISTFAEEEDVSRRERP
jgi:hypothetical protein